MGQIETESWYDEASDFLLIKVRIWEKTPDGKPSKRGMIFKMSAEYLASLPHVAEAMNYTHTVDPKALEFVGPEKLEDKKICNDGLDVSMCCTAPTRRVDTGMFGDMRVCTKCGK
jgi:hypothetical protein